MRNPSNVAGFVWLGAAIATGCAAPVPPGATARSVDHHLHIRSQVAADHQERLEEVLGEGGPNQEESKGITAAEAIEALDVAGIEGGLVFSNAYMFGMPEAEAEHEAERVRAENEYVATEVAKYPDRLVGFCSFNPLTAYALEELAHCGEDERIGGLKLHLTNSDVDLRRPEHIRALAAVFALSNQLGLPVAVHMRTRAPDYGAEDAAIFIDQVLSQAPDVPVQIAHMAGWGGYDDAADAAMSAFVDALAEEQRGVSHVSFGLGAVVFQPEAAGADTVLADEVREANHRLAARIRDVGTERVVYATDWPSWPPTIDPATKIERNILLIRTALPLSDWEIDDILRNVAPVFTSPRR